MGRLLQSDVATQRVSAHFAMAKRTVDLFFNNCQATVIKSIPVGVTRRGKIFFPFAQKKNLKAPKKTWTGL